jgi:translocation protein SEC63
LTDETIRENWEKYGHPDGRQEVSTGIAIPAWVVEGKNSVYVLALYGLLFGGALPALVGRWWFGHRDKTKDGVRVGTASAFWKGLTEQADLSETIGVIGTAKEWEEITTSKDETELAEIQKKVEENVKDFEQIKKLARKDDGSLNQARLRALVLLYSHLLRVPVSSAQLAKGIFLLFIM